MANKDHTGSRFGRLAVLGLHEIRDRYFPYWLVKCDCGVEKVVRGAHLVSGRTISCGCVRNELSRERRIAARLHPPRERKPRPPQKPRSPAIRQAEYAADPQPHRERAKRYYREHMRREKVLWLNAKNRAKARGLRFEIAIEDVVFPDRCPILDIPLVLNRGCAGPNSPSIDRIIPDLGYVPGNVQIISHKANTMKSNASIEELRALLAFMERTCPPQEVSA